MWIKLFTIWFIMQKLSNQGDLHSSRSPKKFYKIWWRETSCVKMINLLCHSWPRKANLMNQMLSPSAFGWQYISFTYTAYRCIGLNCCLSQDQMPLSIHTYIHCFYWNNVKMSSDTKCSRVQNVCLVNIETPTGGLHSIMLELGLPAGILCYWWLWYCSENVECIFL